MRHRGAGKLVRPSSAAGDQDRGSVLPLVTGLAVMLLVLCMGIVAASDVWLTRNRLTNRCEGAALAASSAADVPGVRRSEQDANAAAIRYLSTRSATVGVTVDVGPDTVVARCWSTEDITFGWLFLTPTLKQEVTAASRLQFR